MSPSPAERVRDLLTALQHGRDAVDLGLSPSSECPTLQLRPRGGCPGPTPSRRSAAAATPASALSGRHTLHVENPCIEPFMPFAGVNGGGAPQRPTGRWIGFHSPSQCQSYVAPTHRAARASARSIGRITRSCDPGMGPRAPEGRRASSKWLHRPFPHTSAASNVQQH